MYACFMYSPIDNFAGWNYVKKDFDLRICEEHVYWDGVPNKVTDMVYKLGRVYPSSKYNHPMIHYAPLPAPYGELNFVVAVKVENNGDTYLISDYLLPWIETSDGWHEVKE